MRSPRAAHLSRPGSAKRCRRPRHPDVKHAPGRTGLRQAPDGHARRALPVPRCSASSRAICGRQAGLCDATAAWSRHVPAPTSRDAQPSLRRLGRGAGAPCGRRRRGCASGPGWRRAGGRPGRTRCRSPRPSGPPSRGSRGLRAPPALSARAAGAAAAHVVRRARRQRGADRVACAAGLTDGGRKTCAA
jgi:hypothetical protein